MGEIDGLFCLGDSIEQTRFCAETVALLRDHKAIALVGNHEEAFFAGPGASQANPDLAEWLGSRPSSLELEIAGLRIKLVHSTSWPSGHAYVPETHPDFRRFAESGVDILLYGHTHQPIVRRVVDTLVVNPGSVGEGRPTSRGFVRSCAIVDLDRCDAAIIDFD